MMNLKLIFIFSILSLSLIGCGSTEIVTSDKISADVIHQSYTVTYNPTNDQTLVRAQFRVGGSTGTTIELVSPSQIEHSSLDLEGKNLVGFGQVYQNSTDGFVPSHTFQFTDPDGTLFENSLSLKTIDFPDGFENSVISRDEDLVLTWDGDAISENERVRVILVSENAASSAQVFVESEEGKTNIRIPSVELLRLPAGGTQIDLERSLIIHELEQGQEVGGRRIGTVSRSTQITLN